MVALLLSLLVQSVFADNATSCSISKISTNQVHKNPRPVEYRGKSEAPEGMSDSEWADRVELAALACQCRMCMGLVRTLLPSVSWRDCAIRISPTQCS